MLGYSGSGASFELIMSSRQVVHISCAREAALEGVGSFFARSSTGRRVVESRIRKLQASLCA